MVDATPAQIKTYCMHVTFYNKKTGEESDETGDEQWFGATDDADAKKQAKAFIKYSEYDKPIFSISVREHRMLTLQAAFEGEQVWADALAYYDEFPYDPSEEDDGHDYATPIWEQYGVPRWGEV